MIRYRALLGPVTVVIVAAATMLWSPLEPHGPAVSDAPAPPSTPIFARSAEGSSRPAAAWADEDWTAFAAKVEWAARAGVDSLPLGRAMAELGRSFVGTAYVPGTLEVEGPERLVIDFRGFDCVTFVENVMALALFVRGGGAALVEREPGEAQRVYASILQVIRYRDGVIEGYPSRLHYFSDWVAHHDERGLVRDLTEELGGTLDPEPVDFMTSNPGAYRQLADPAVAEAVRSTEERLTARARRRVPQERISEVEDRIRDGDIIAATSTVRGLDVAHTGLALRVDGELRLLHAPLVGEAVQISEVPLSERILGIAGQDGIIVARPQER